jgi:hypothetical protein
MAVSTICTGHNLFYQIKYLYGIIVQVEHITSVLSVTSRMTLLSFENKQFLVALPTGMPLAGQNNDLHN